MRILVLTKCIFREKILEEKIRFLGHEVFSSETLVEEGFEMIPFFHVVIFSDTLSEKEQAAIAKAIKHRSIPLLTVSSEENLSSTKLAQEIIPHDCSVEGLRLAIEFTFQAEIRSDYPQYSFLFFNTSDLKRRLHLSELELRIMECLYNAGGKAISKAEISQLVWKKELNQSRMCHISTLINKVRRKMKLDTPQQYKIETDWGKGYYLVQLDR